jgi:hypothetical protein
MRQVPRMGWFKLTLVLASGFGKSLSSHMLEVLAGRYNT